MSQPEQLPPVDLGSPEFRARVFQFLDATDPSTEDLIRKFAELPVFAGGEVFGVDTARAQQPEADAEADASDASPQPARKQRVQKEAYVEPPIPVAFGPRASDDAAACRLYEKANPDLRFEKLQSYHAMEICGHCAVRLACLKFELVNDTSPHVRGGLTARQRDELRPAYLRKLKEDAAVEAAVKAEAEEES